MYVKDTVYHLATTSAHYKRARQFLSNHDAVFERLTFPTITAERDDEIIGVLSTQHHDSAIIAGPLVVDIGDGNPSFVVIRLWQAYERVLHEAGVTEYLFAVPEGESAWNEAVNQMEVDVWKHHKGAIWYRKGVEWDLK